MYKLFIISLIMLLSSSLDAKITPELMAELNRASSNEVVSCIVIMKTKYSYDKMAWTPLIEKITTYRNIAKQSQEPLLQALSKRSSDVKKCEQFWVINGLHVKALPHVIREIAARSDVEQVLHNAIAKVYSIPQAAKKYPHEGIEWGVQKIEADKCWTEGYTGDGVLIGIVDSGTDYLHPALEDKWSGDWHDAINGRDTPYDDFYHGTHCTGTICGGDGYGDFPNDIGVAPGVKYASAKGLNSGGSGSTAELVECLEFMADLRERKNIRVVSCSWCSSSGGSTGWLEAFKTLRSIGILPVCANGNTGASGVCSPGDYPNVIGVGATDDKDEIANFSSLGPAKNQALYNDESLWFRDDWNYIKPNISAPGVNVNSCVQNGEYRLVNGTSMATPHVCGAAALLFQKNPNLTPEMVYSLLLDNVDKPSAGGTYPNNTFGWGRLNIYKALQATPPINKPSITMTAQTMDDLKPGETVDLKIAVKNMGGVDGKNITAQLVSPDNFITIQNGSYSFGTLTPKQEADNNNNPFKVSAHTLTPAGHETILNLIFHADGPQDSLDYDDTVDITFTIGTAPEPYAVYEDDFEYNGGDNFSTYWETSGWSRVSDESHSPSHSVFASSKGSRLSLKTGIDLSALHEPKLVFWSRDEFSWPQEWNKCEISASPDGGNSWTQISGFAGSANGTAWQSREASLSSFTGDNVKIRFDFTGQDKSRASGFWIDDFKIQVKTDNEPPHFGNTTLWKETSQTGPFPVQSMVSDVSGVKEVNLFYRIGSGAWTKQIMNGQGSNDYEASIPQQSGTNITIDYYLEAADMWLVSPGNTGTFPVGADQSGNYHSFISGSTGIHPNDQAVTFYYLNSHHVNGMVNMKFYLPYVMNVKISLFDVTGKEVVNIINKKLTVGDHAIKSNVHKRIASGFYLLAFEAHPVNVTVTNRSYKKIEKVLFLH